MNFEQSEKTQTNNISSGYKMIIEDTEEKYIYLTYKNGNPQETPREELLEIIKSGKPIPLLEIRKRIRG